MRKTFENEIQQVKDEVLLLGSMVEQAILEFGRGPEETRYRSLPPNLWTAIR